MPYMLPLLYSQAKQTEGLRVTNMIQIKPGAGLLIKYSKLTIPTGGGWPVGYLQGVDELNSGPPKTKPSGGREEDLNPDPPVYKSSALPLGHARLLGNVFLRK